MKILRIFGIVLAVHAFAFILIFANPGCSTKTKTAAAPAPAESRGDAGGPLIAMPKDSAAAGSQSASPFAPAPLGGGAGDSGGLAFDPNAPATGSVRFMPTRPHSPAATALQAEPVADVTPATTVTVTKGDSLWSIAKKHGVSYTELAAVNHLKPSATLQLGQKLVVPTKPGAAAASRNGAATSSTKAVAPSTKAAGKKAETSAKVAAGANVMKHVVKPGEKLSTIAKKYVVKVGDLAEANSITNPALIRAGQELVIPGWQAPKASGATAAAPAAADVSHKSGAAAPADTGIVPGSSTAPVMPQIGVPPPDQDLDAGLKQAPASKIPVIRVDDAPASPTPVETLPPAPKN